MRISDWSSDVCSSDLERARKDLAHRGRYLGLPRPAERAFGAEFAQFEKGDPDLVERLGGGDEHRFGVAILHALRIAIGGEAHRGAIRAGEGGASFDHFEQQENMVLGAAAVAKIGSASCMDRERHNVYITTALVFVKKNNTIKILFQQSTNN